MPPAPADPLLCGKPHPCMHAGSDEGRACQMSRTETFSMARLLAAAVGGFLFWNAAPLSTSTPFRWG